MTKDASAPPLVTVAIPLYRSRRFLEVITENIRNLDYPNLEILVSDRHLADDTVEQLRVLFADDSRIRFITARDEVGWVANYNLLLAEGSGEYFIWMPHDDSYPPGYVGTLVDRLEAAPDAILAFGPCDTKTPDGTPYKIWPDPPFSSNQKWTARAALRMFYGWNIGVAMRGAFRRRRIIESDLWVPHTTGDAYADVCWLFGVALVGRFEFVPETRCLKRFYAGSTHTAWKAPKAGELPRLMAGYLGAYVPSTRQRIPAMAWVWFGAVANRAVLLVNQLARREMVSEEALRRAFRWALR